MVARVEENGAYATGRIRGLREQIEDLTAALARRNVVREWYVESYRMHR